MHPKIAKVFCCDLLSIAMSKAPENGAWVTVMGNKNTLAVASLADVSCIILAEGITFSDEDLACAKRKELPSLRRNYRSLMLRLRFRSCCHDSLYYDLHMHSCLSPCGDDDMTLLISWAWPPSRDWM